MSDETDFLRGERKDLEKTVGLIEPLLAKKSLTDYEIIAMGKLLQDVYMGIERILRCQLEGRGIKIGKSANWHKDLLQTASKETGNL